MLRGVFHKTICSVSVAVLKMLNIHFHITMLTKRYFLGNNYRQDNARLKLHMSKYIFDIDANIAFKFTDSKQPEYSIKENVHDFSACSYL